MRPRPALQRALREDRERAAAFCGVDELVGVLGAFLHVEALDEETAEATEEQPHHRVGEELALGNEA